MRQKDIGAIITLVLIVAAAEFVIVKNKPVYLNYNDNNSVVTIAKGQPLIIKLNFIGMNTYAGIDYNPDFIDFESHAFKEPRRVDWMNNPVMTSALDKFTFIPVHTGSSDIEINGLTDNEPFFKVTVVVH